jgi:hypothetical protein
LRADDAAHVAIARRLRRLGRPDDRATLFKVAAVPALVLMNPTADSDGVGNTAAGRGKLALGVIAGRRGESATGHVTEAQGGAESVARPAEGRAA